jgi:glycosyltransferase involved in cell wall biosynthesis
MKKQSSVVVSTPFTNNNWKWFAPSFDDKQIHWSFYCEKPQGFIEKYIRQPNLAMIRSCREAVKATQKNHADLLFTHDPRVSFWCAFFAERLGVKTEHIAYSFNFPDLPRGLKRRWMTSAFKNISRFIVYSKMEKQLYHDYFGIPLERIDVVLWSVGTPEVSPQEPLESGDYICAIGGNARDYQTLMAAMEKLPDIPLVLVARPHNLKNLNIPSNVKVLVNIPKPHAMNIIKHSRFMVLPLTGSEVPCGHVTLVAAMHLGKGFIITNSSGVSDYVFHDHNAVTCEAFSADALADAISSLWKNPDKCQQLGENGLKFAQEHCSEASAREHLRNLLVERKLLLD